MDVKMPAVLAARMLGGVAERLEVDLTVARVGAAGVRRVRIAARARADTTTCKLPTARAMFPTSTPRTDPPVSDSEVGGHYTAACQEK